jgi:molybdopterin/thiamine biosynthesis adenylyltransferase
MPDDFQERFARQISLPEIGLEGQRRLSRATVAVVGLGGLGSPAALYLAAAGVGTLVLIDGDRLDVSNLQRQILYNAAEVGQLKAECADRRLRALWPGLKTRVESRHLAAETAGEQLAGVDVIVEATDRVAAKLMTARVARALGKPCVHGGIVGFEGQILTVEPGRSTCYGCLWSGLENEPAHTPRGPLGAVPGVIGSLQAAEAIKVILGIGRLLTDRLLICDLLTMVWRTVEVRPNPGCDICGTLNLK